MIVPPLPDNERERLDALYSYGILDTGAESDFDELVKLASHICDTPISLITLIDPRFADNPLVTGSPDIRFYAGMPLSTPTGYKFGTLCVIDTKPNHLTPMQRDALQILGKQAMKLMELRRRNEEMKLLAELHKRLLFIIGHDLRSPSASLHNLLEVAIDGDLDMQEFREMLPDLQRSVASSLLLLNNLLDWASSQLSGRKVGRKPIPLKKVTDQIITILTASFQEKGNRIDSTLTEGDIAIGDRHMTDFILRNLLMNANKFMDGGSVTIRATLESDSLVLSVSDDGPGIAPNVLANLFSWELRTTTVGSAGERGSGLGLPMCLEFARAQGGDLWAESTLGHGATFHLRLPKA